MNKQERNLYKILQYYMARKFPRFLFSNPLNTKSKGPFIIHTLPPTIICKVYNRRSFSYNANEHINALHFGNFAIEYLDSLGSDDKNQISDIMLEMSNWLNKQIQLGEIDPNTIP